MASNSEAAVGLGSDKLSSTKEPPSEYQEFSKDIESEHTLLKKSLSKCFSDNVDRISSIQILSDHINALQTLRDTYTKRYILSIREEIQKLWDLCVYGVSQRSNFQAYNSETFTIDVLVEHENELKELKECYALHRDLYKLASKREKLWNEKIAFENPEDGSARFENRGGTLIKELKKYQNAEKQLPIVEKEIKTMVKSWEVSNGKQFVVHDMQYVEYMEKQKQDYKDEKEIKRNAKKAAKQEEMQSESSTYIDSSIPSPKGWPSVDHVLTLKKGESGSDNKETKKTRKSSTSTPRSRVGSVSSASGKIGGMEVKKSSKNPFKYNVITDRNRNDSVISPKMMNTTGLYVLHIGIFLVCKSSSLGI